MLKLWASDWEKMWKLIHEQYAGNIEQTVDQRFATRAVSFDNTFTIAGNEIGNLSHELVGYTKLKLKMFEDRYIIPGRLESLIAKLQERSSANKDLTIMSYPFNIDNQAHDQGACVINMTVTLVKRSGTWYTSYRINMRMGEITRRLLVDFVKFHGLIKEIEDSLSSLKKEMTGITVYSTAIYAQPSSVLIAEAIFKDTDKPLIFESEHWFHRAIKAQKLKFAKGGIKHRMTARIGRYVEKLNEK